MAEDRIFFVIPGCIDHKSIAKVESIPVMELWNKVTHPTLAEPVTLNFHIKNIKRFQYLVISMNVDEAAIAGM